MNLERGFKHAGKSLLLLAFPQVATLAEKKERKKEGKIEARALSSSSSLSRMSVCVIRKTQKQTKRSFSFEARGKSQLNANSRAAISPFKKKNLFEQ